MKSAVRLTSLVHELSICEAVLHEVLAIAEAQRARRVGRITLRLGPLAGVEPDLVRLAFPLVGGARNRVFTGPGVLPGMRHGL